MFNFERAVGTLYTTFTMCDLKHAVATWCDNLKNVIQNTLLQLDLHM